MPASSSPSSSSGRLSRLGTALALVVAGAVAGCAAVRIPEANETLAARLPGATVQELAEGRRLYVNRCSGCHHLKSPGEYAPEEWPKEVREMRKKAKLDDEKQALITRFLQAASLEVRSPTPPPAPAPTPPPAAP